MGAAFYWYYFERHKIISADGDSFDTCYNRIQLADFAFFGFGLIFQNRSILDSNDSFDPQK